MTDNGVLVLSGPPCSGKSSVGRILATDAQTSRPRRVHIEVDALFTLLLPDSDRRREDRLLAYDAAHLLARMLVERGSTVVLECTYARREQRLSLLDALAGGPDTPLWVVEFLVSGDEAVQRFLGRDEATDLDEESVRERAAEFPYSAHALRVTSSVAAPPDLARQITEWLSHQPPPAPRDSWAAAGRGWD